MNWSERCRIKKTNRRRIAWAKSVKLLTIRLMKIVTKVRPLWRKLQNLESPKSSLITSKAKVKTSSLAFPRIRKTTLWGWMIGFYRDCCVKTFAAASRTYTSFRWGSNVRRDSTSSRTTSASSRCNRNHATYRMKTMWGMDLSICGSSTCSSICRRASAP